MYTTYTVSTIVVQRTVSGIHIHAFTTCEYLRTTPGKLPMRILSGPRRRTHDNDYTYMSRRTLVFFPSRTCATGPAKDRNIKPKVLYTLCPCVRNRRLLCGRGLNELTSPSENIIYRIDSSSRRSRRWWHPTRTSRPRRRNHKDRPVFVSLLFYTVIILSRQGDGIRVVISNTA